MKKKLFLLQLWALFLVLIVSCRKTENDSKVIAAIQSSKNGFGAILDRKAYLATKHANLDSLKAILISAGLLKNIKVDGPPPTSIILNHPPVGDQTPTGTCVSWASYAMAGTLNNEFPTVGITSLRSPWYVYQVDHSQIGDCNTTNGMPLINGPYILTHNGIPAYTLDTGLGSPCSFPGTSINTDAATNKISGYAAVSTVAEIKTALSMHLPV